MGIHPLLPPDLADASPLLETLYSHIKGIKFNKIILTDKWICPLSSHIRNGGEKMNGWILILIFGKTAFNLYPVKPL